MNNSTPVTTASNPAHNTGTNGKWRQAATTSDVESVSPSQPRAGRRSNKDRANTLALSEANKEHHRWCQTWMSRPSKIRGQRAPSPLPTGKRKGGLHATNDLPPRRKKNHQASPARKIGHVNCFRWRASWTTAPSSSAQRRRGWPLV